MVRAGLHSTVSEHSRNSINNNISDNSHTNKLDNYNTYDTQYSTNIKSICQPGPPNSSMNDQKVNIYDNKQAHYNDTIYNGNKDITLITATDKDQMIIALQTQLSQLI